MSTITTIQSSDAISASRSTINTNFSNLNTDKAETSALTSGLSTKQDTLVSGTTIKTINGNSVLGSGDLTITASANIPVKDEGTTITSAVSSFNFVGSGVTATNVGNDVTVTIAGGGGSGDVVGPASATDNAIARFDTTTGKLIQNSAATIADTTGDITAGKYNTVAISGSSTPTLAVTGTTAVSGTNTGDETTSRINTLYGTTNAFTAGSIEVGHASDTTLSRVSAGVIAVEGVTVPTISSTSTLTNKTLIDTTNVISENTTTASSATPAPTGGSLRNFFTVTALAAGATFSAPSGTPANGNLLFIRIKDNGTARSLAWNAIYRAGNTALPTTTIISKTMYLLFAYNSADSKWDLIAYNDNF